MTGSDLRRRLRRVLTLGGTLLAALPGGSLAAPPCEPVAPVACPRCFAVFVMPDTQLYTEAGRQPFGAAHLDLVTRYICANRERWVEPRTGKAMPIVMVLHLGDLVQNGDRNENGTAPLAEWARVDAAFDNLDACEPAVPYLVTIGNHDIAGGNYQGESEGYNTYFGTQRWEQRGVACSDPARCDWDAGEWFIGGGDPIEARSRNNVGGGEPGPATRQPGRHRAGVIRVPGGQRLLFVGVEQAVDYPPPAPGFERVEGDDLRWVRQVLDDYAGVPTLMFHHSMFWSYGAGDPRVRFGPETWMSDSIGLPRETSGPQRGMRDLWDRIVAPFPQVFLLVSGHVLRPAMQGDFVVERAAGPPVHGFLRNFQTSGIPGDLDPYRRYGVGWNVIAAFDPDAGEIRVRSYRIDDADSVRAPLLHRDHEGEPAPTECLDTDHPPVGERVVRWRFPEVAGAAAARP